jgi:DNA-3-methyladenine glycosylase
MSAHSCQPTVATRLPPNLPAGRLLADDFFARSSELVAHDLIGKILWREGVGGGRLTEVEAYLPNDDPACHAACGLTRRNAAMFGPPGTVYVYLSYGVHVLLNLVCDRERVGSAVLIRSFEPLGDMRHLRLNRARNGKTATPAGASVDHLRLGPLLSCGPGRVGQALDLHLGLDGLSLGEASGLYVIDDGVATTIERTERIGISKGDRLLLRFVMSESAYVSRRARLRGGRTG